MLQVVFLCTNRTCCLASRHLLAVGKEIAFGARSAILLKSREILNHDPLLLRRDGSRASFSHQEDDPFTVLCLACVIAELVLGEILFVREVCIAQLAYQGPLMMGLSEKVRSSSPAISPPGTYVAGPVLD